MEAAASGYDQQQQNPANPPAGQKQGGAVEQKQEPAKFDPRPIGTRQARDGHWHVPEIGAAIIVQPDLRRSSANSHWDLQQRLAVAAADRARPYRAALQVRHDRFAQFVERHLLRQHWRVRIARQPNRLDLRMAKLRDFLGPFACFAPSFIDEIEVSL